MKYLSLKAGDLSLIFELHGEKTKLVSLTYIHTHPLTHVIIIKLFFTKGRTKEMSQEFDLLEHHAAVSPVRWLWPCTVLFLIGAEGCYC